VYFPDLSSYQYIKQELGPILLNVGWLDKTHEYKSGEVSDIFIERLWLFCQSSTHHTLGFHVCSLCIKPAFGLCVHRGDEDLWLGSAEIRVFGSNGVAYAAPNLIYHYVVDHHYYPPEEFINAVLEGPIPDSPEYWEHAKHFQWGRMALRERKLLGQ
jgi:hypothetical protein